MPQSSAPSRGQNAPRVIRVAASYCDATTIEDFEQVLEAASAGTEWAAAILFDALQPSLLRYLRWEEPGAADDLAGETWLAVAERIQDFVGDERALRAWVFSVARRRLADHRRRGARRRTQPVAPQDLLEVPGGEDPADVVLEALSAQQAIDHLVATLSPGQAEVLVLRVVARLSVDDVAQILGKRPGTVRVIEHRALRRLSRDGVDQVPTTKGVMP
jgi:RNA polymerase sigma-70 factor (ECF subfamily)